jgi:hypothetical protein
VTRLAAYPSDELFFFGIDQRNVWWVRHLTISRVISSEIEFCFATSANVVTNMDFAVDRNAVEFEVERTVFIDEADPNLSEVRLAVAFVDDIANLHLHKLPPEKRYRRLSVEKGVECSIYLLDVVTSDHFDAGPFEGANGREETKEGHTSFRKRQFERILGGRNGLASAT